MGYLKSFTSANRRVPPPYKINMSAIEPVVSSSPMSMQNGSNKKRSISTSLVDFFNKIKNSNNNTYSIQNNNNDNNYNNHKKKNDADDTQNLPSRKKKKLGYPEASSIYNMRNSSNNHNNNNDIYQNDINNNSIQEPLILYANEDEDGSMEVVRPPILPILPVQRLKLLKQKQMLRLQNDSRLINQNFNNISNNNNSNHINDINKNKPLLLQNINTSHELSSPTQEYDQSVIIHKSGTPSPVKNPSGINELILDSNNNIINKKPELHLHNNSNSNNNKSIQLRTLQKTVKPNKSNLKGTKWSGNFEYDLSEYDTKPITQNNSIVNNKNTMGISNIVNTDVSPKIPITKSNKLVESNHTNKLSKTKLDLLINGFDSDKLNTSTKMHPTAIAPVVKEDKILKLDTKINDSSKSGKKSNSILPNMGFDFIKDNETPSKQVSFSFDKKDKSTTTTEKEKESKPLLFSLDSNKTKESDIAPKLSFSFGPGLKSKNDEEEPNRKKRAAPAVTIDMTENINKPTFSFGAIKPAENTDKSAEKKAPSFSFGIKPPATEKASSDKPSFSFGGIGSKPKNTKIDEAVSKPTFSFGASTNTNADEKKDDQDEEEPRRKKPAFSFGTTPATTTTPEPSTESKPSFSFGLTGAQDKKEEEKKTPSFSFGLTKPPVATEEKKTPSFSFGAGASTKTALEETAAKKPTLFSFDKKPSSEGPATNIEKPSFSFGAKLSTPSEGTKTNIGSNPLFSLNKPIEAGNEKPTAPSFSFGAAPAITTTDATKDKPANPLLSKPSFNFGSTVSKENTPSPSTTPVPSFSFNKPPANNSTTQLNQEAKSLGVSLNNPLLSKPSGFGAPANNVSAPKLFSGAPPAVANASAPSTGGFSFSRQQTPGLAGASVTPGASLFGGINSNNSISNNNSAGGFNFGLSSGSTTPAVNPLLSSNNGMQPGGSVFSGGITPNNMSGGASTTQPMGNANFNFGQPQQQQQPQIPTFNPSNQVNIQFNQNATANPMDIFGGSSNNSNANLNNNLTPQPSQFQTRKIARMRGSRR